MPSLIIRAKQMDGRAQAQAIGSFTDHMKHASRYASYQRTNTWDDWMHADYIGSLLKGEQPPPIVINNKVENDRPVSYIIDGGHRTRAILDFQEGVFPVHLEGINWYFKKGNKDLKKNDRILSEVDQFDFRQIAIQILCYQDLQEDQEHQIFQDSNKQKPLTRGQLIIAVDTPFVRALNNVIKNHGEKLEETIDTRFSKRDDNTLIGNMAAFIGVEVLNKGTYELKDTTWTYYPSIVEGHSKHSACMESIDKLDNSLQKLVVVATQLHERKAFGKSKMPKSIILPILKVFYEETIATTAQLITAIQTLENYPDSVEIKQKWNTSMAKSNMNANKEVRERTQILKEIIRQGNIDDL